MYDNKKYVPISFINTDIKFLNKIKSVRTGYQNKEEKEEGMKDRPNDKKWVCPYNIHKIEL